MLADSRSGGAVRRASRAQWLRLQDLDQLIPDYLHYPAVRRDAGDAMEQETKLFFDSIVREDRSVLDLLTADYTFVNERLAGTTASRMSRATRSSASGARVPPRAARPGQHPHAHLGGRPHVAGAARQVGDGSAARHRRRRRRRPTCRARRLGRPAGGRKLSVRERMEQHRKNPACNSCHRVIDPLGLALDNFDVTGAWRIKDNEVPVDSHRATSTTAPR
jgi:hypothetical protein